MITFITFEDFKDFLKVSFDFRNDFIDSLKDILEYKPLRTSLDILKEIYEIIKEIKGRLEEISNILTYVVECH